MRILSSIKTRRFSQNQNRRNQESCQVFHLVRFCEPKLYCFVESISEPRLGRVNHIVRSINNSDDQHPRSINHDNSAKSNLFTPSTPSHTVLSQCQPAVSDSSTSSSDHSHPRWSIKEYKPRQRNEYSLQIRKHDLRQLLRCPKSTVLPIHTCAYVESTTHCTMISLLG